MFSPAIYSLKATLFKVHFDTQPPIPTRHRKRVAKLRIHGSKIYAHGQDFRFSVEHETPFVESLRCLYEENASCSDTLASNQLTESYVLGYLLQSCCNVKEVRKVHAIAVKCARESKFYVENNLISIYVKLGYLVEAQRVFDNMLERNVVSWTAMINGYMRFGLYKEAMRLLAEFVHEDFQWNSKTFVCVLNLIARRFDSELGKQVHACVLKSGFSGLILESSVLHFYSQCGDLEGAFRIFDKMKERDVVSWTTLITACSQHGQGKKALIMFSKMISDGFDANEFTVCSVLNACGDEKELRFGTQLLGAIVKRIYKMDVFVRTSIVNMFAKCGQIANARKIFDGTRKKNIVTWTSIIAGYARNGLAEEAITLCRIMTRKKIFANKLTMVSVLRACGKLRALQTGKEVHARIIKNHLQSNIYIGSSLVWLYCKCGENSMAHKVLQGMPFRDVVSWTAMISGCAHLGHEHEALEYLKKMVGEGVLPNSFTYLSALKACTKLEDIERGKSIHSSINKTPSISNVFVGSALINMYAKCGHLPEAIQVFDSMPERNVVSWKAMVIAYAKHGFCGEALKLLYRMQAEDIKVDDYILLTVLSACGDFEESLELSTEYHLDIKQ